MRPMAAFIAHSPTLYSAPRCRICGRGANDAVDIDGAVCGGCLRNMNADPLAKRRVILGFGQFDL